MTDVLHVGRLRARYRLAADDGERRRELDALLDRVVAEALEPALARCGVPVDEEICVRSVEAPVRLRLAAGDAAAAAVWAAAIAEAIASALAAGSPDVVRYRSRRAALADFALGVASGRLERVWAWRRLGLWRGGDLPGDRAAAAELVAALAGEAEAIAPVLARVARAGALERLLVTVAPADWTALATRALETAGVSAAALDAALTSALRAAAVPAADEPHAAGVDELTALPDIAGGVPSAPGSTPPADVSGRRAARIIRASALARAVLGAGNLDPVRLAALAVLAALEAEPALLVARPPAEVGALVSAIAEQLTCAPGRAPELPSPPEQPGAPELPRVPESPRAPESPSVPEAAQEADTAPRPTAPDGSERAHSEPRAPVPDAQPEAPRHFTAHGGLLFLLGVLDALEVPPVLAARERPLPWTLHLLALALAPVEPEDPAALAFAGLAPGSDPPTVADPPEQHELDATTALADALGQHVWQRLQAPEATPTEALEFVIRRRGEIVFEPGWIELRLPLDEVSVELRRAGLDLDPGWLPWLGAVLRFVYA